MYTDTHCHISLMEAEVAPEDLITRAREAGVSRIVTVGVDLASSAEAIQVASSYPEVWAVVGIHPHNAIEATEHVLRRLASIAQHPRVVGIGETGLDYFRDHSPKVRQEEAFRDQIRMAKDLDKTLVIHVREAHEDLLRILTDERAPERTVMHCFSGGPDLVRTCAEHDWFLSFAGNVTFANAPALREAAAAAPIELLLTETDSPYLSPHPHRGQRNEPSRVPLVAAQLATLHDLELEAFAAIAQRNATRAFGLPEA